MAPGTATEETTMVKFLTETELADLIGQSVRCVRDWRQVGRGPKFCKLGRRVAYRESDVLTWIESRVVSSTGEFGCLGERQA